MAAVIGVTRCFRIQDAEESLLLTGTLQASKERMRDTGDAEGSGLRVSRIAPGRGGHIGSSLCVCAPR